MTDAVRPDRALLQALERLLELGIIPDVGPALRRSSNHVDSVLLILGLAVSLVGAGVTASSVVIDEKTADQLAAMKWGANSQLKQALLDQSHAARNGLILIAFGSALQMGGVVWQTVKGRRVEAPGMIPREQETVSAFAGRHRPLQHRSASPPIPRCGRREHPPAKYGREAGRGRRRNSLAGAPRRSPLLAARLDGLHRCCGRLHLCGARRPGPAPLVARSSA